MALYQKFRKLSIDHSAIELGLHDMEGTYFCTPKGRSTSIPHASHIPIQTLSGNLPVMTAQQQINQLQLLLKQILGKTIVRFGIKAITIEFPRKGPKRREPFLPLPDCVNEVAHFPKQIVSVFSDARIQGGIRQNANRASYRCSEVMAFFSTGLRLVPVHLHVVPITLAEHPIHDSPL